jgi:predicted HTH transcriptional regulator
MSEIIKKLTITEIINILKSTPEQQLFDWKSDLVLTKNHDCEIIKDIAAIANATTKTAGYIFYGVNPDKPDPLIGISHSHDDANIQQLVEGKVDPPIKFLYYEVSYNSSIIGIIHVPPSFKRPHIIAVNIEKLRAGQIPIRKGSTTTGITQHDLFECFYGKDSPYFNNVLRKVGAESQLLQAQAIYDAQSMRREQEIERQMRRTLGLE